jgi:prevent-host-death family protein
VTTSEPVPVTDARAQLSDLVGRVAFAGERVPLSRHGRVRAAIVSADDLALLEALDEQAQDGSPESPVVPPFRAISGESGTATERTSIAAELAPAAHHQPQPGSPGSTMG